MSRTVSPSSGQPYGLALVCRIWRAPRATVYRRRAGPRTEPPQRRGPVGPMPDAALLIVSCSRFPWTPICPAGGRCGEVQHEQNHTR
jgi:hypothetical protein